MNIARLLPESPSSSDRPLFHDRPVVLIAEDQPRMHERLVGQFLEPGVNPTVVANGAEAIRVAGQLHPALVLLDGLLPLMHEFEIARVVRHLDSTYRPHIAVLTGICRGSRYRNGARLNLGIDDFLVKPASPARLGGLVTRARRAI